MPWRRSSGAGKLDEPAVTRRYRVGESRVRRVLDTVDYAIDETRGPGGGSTRPPSTWRSTSMGCWRHAGAAAGERRQGGDRLKVLLRESPSAGRRTRPNSPDRFCAIVCLQIFERMRAETCGRARFSRADRGSRDHQPPAKPVPDYSTRSPVEYCMPPAIRCWRSAIAPTCGNHRPTAHGGRNRERPGTRARRGNGPAAVARVRPRRSGYQWTAIM